MSQVDLQTIWNKVIDQVKQKVIHPTLWRTIELGVPVTVEGNDFIVGFGAGNFHLSGHLTISEHKNAIEAALKQFTGHSLNLRVIDGTTLADWQAVKVKEASMKALKDAAYQKQAASTAVTRNWDTLLEQVGRKYATLPLRQLPQSRAIYIEEVMEMISETMDELMPKGGPTDEIAERALARIIERAGTLAEVPSAMLALEIKRMREERGK